MAEGSPLSPLKGGLPLYLYLGQDTVIRTCDIIGIFDLDNTSTSKLTKAYLSRAQRENRVVEVTSELPKSFVVCSSREGGAALYLSQISPATLLKRANEPIA